MFTAFKRLCVFLLAAVVFFPIGSASADVSLPASQRTGGSGVFDVLGSHNRP